MSDQTITRAAASGAIMQSARGHIKNFWGIGLGLLVVGGLITGASLPSVQPSLYGPPVQSGSMSGFVIGLILVAIGQVALLVAIVATGVRLGVDSATTSS